MTSILKENADTIAAALNGEDFNLAFEAQVSFRPRAEVRDRSQLAVLVVPGKITTERETRTHLRRSLETYVVIQRRLIDEDEDIQELLQLAEEIETFLAGRTLDGRFTCATTERDPPFIVEHADQMALFTAVISTTWRVTY